MSVKCVYVRQRRVIRWRIKLDRLRSRLLSVSFLTSRASRFFRPGDHLKLFVAHMSLGEATR